MESSVLAAESPLTFSLVSIIKMDVPAGKPQESSWGDEYVPNNNITSSTQLVQMMEV